MTFRIPWSEAVLSIIHSLLDSKVLGGHIIETIYSHTLSRNTHPEIIGKCKQLKVAETKIEVVGRTETLIIPTNYLQNASSTTTQCFGVVAVISFHFHF